MKTNTPHIDHVPRPDRPHPAAPKCRVMRIASITRIWWDRVGSFQRDCDLEIPTELSDEALDLVKLAYARGDRSFTLGDLERIQQDQTLIAQQREHAIAFAPRSWRKHFGLPLRSGVPDDDAELAAAEK